MRQNSSKYCNSKTMDTKRNEDTKTNNIYITSIFTLGICTLSFAAAKYMEIVSQDVFFWFTQMNSIMVALVITSFIKTKPRWPTLIGNLERNLNVSIKNIFIKS